MLRPIAHNPAARFDLTHARRSRRKRQQARQAFFRRLGYEPLETRRLLATFASAAGALNLTLSTGDTLNITSAGTQYLLSLSSGMWSGTDGADVAGNNTANLTISSTGITDFTAGININDAGSGGGDSVTFRDSGGFAYANSFHIALAHASISGGLDFQGASTFTAGSSALNATINSGVSVDSAAVVHVGTGAFALSSDGSNSPLDVDGNIISQSGSITLEATGDLDVGAGWTINANSAAIVLAADVTASGTGDDGIGTLNVSAGAQVITSGNITLRGADVALDTSANPAVIGRSPGNVVVATNPGTTLTGFTQPYYTGLYSVDPYGMAFDSTGNLYVADYVTGGTSGRIDKFAPGATTPTATFGSLNEPNTLAFGPDGNLYVGNVGDGTIKEFTPQGSLVATIGGMNWPEAMAFDANGNLFVANFNQGLFSGSVMEFAVGTHSLVTTIHGFASPDALAFDSSGTLYVADQGGNKVSEFAPGATTAGSSLSVSSPDDLVFDAAGDLYVGSFYGQVVEFTPGSTVPIVRTNVGTIGLAVDSQGDIFATVTSGGSVEEFVQGDTSPTVMFTDNEPFREATSLLLDTSGDLYVYNTSASSTVTNIVLEYPATNEATLASGITIESSLDSRPMQIGGTNDAAVDGINLTSAELADLNTSSSGTVTIGDVGQTGNITFTAATPASASGAALRVVEDPAASGQIIFDDAGGTATALKTTGTISLTAGTGGFVAASANNDAPEIATTGSTVTLLTSGPVGTSTNRIQFGDQLNTAEQVVDVGWETFQPSSVYLDGLGNLTLGNIVGGVRSIPIDITARTNLVVAAGAAVASGGGPILLGADLKTDETADDGLGTLSISSGASVETTGKITLRGADIDVSTGGTPASVGSQQGPTSTATLLTGIPNTNPQGLSAMAVDASGNLYVAAGDGSTVSVFAPGATTPMNNITTVSQPYSLLFDSTGDLYVTDLTGNVSGSVVKIAPDGSRTTYGGLDLPIVSALGPDGTLYVGDVGTNDVYEYAPGATMPTVTLSGLGFSYLNELAVDSSGNLYVASVNNSWVDVFAPGATVPTRIIGGFVQTTALLVDPAGNLYVAGGPGGSVEKFAPGATTPALTISGIGLANSLTMDSSGNLYVDTSAGTVYEFAPGSTTPLASVSGVNGGAPMVVDSSGNLYVAESNMTVSKFVHGAVAAGANGVVIQSSVESRPMQIGGTNNAAVAGINLTTAELARIATTGAGTLTIGDIAQTGNITFTTATPVTTAGAALDVIESTTGSGQIILDDGGTSTALATTGGTIELTAGTGGIVAKSFNNTVAEIAASGASVTLLTSGPVGSSTNRIQFADNANTSQQVVIVGSAGAVPSSVYLDGLGSLTLGSVHVAATVGAIDITARTNLVIGTSAAILGVTGPIMLGADLTASEGGDNGTGTLTVSSSVTVVTSGTITLRGADINVDASAQPAVIGGTQVLSPVAAGLVIQSSIESRPMQIGGTNNAAVAGINLTTAELAQMATTSAGTVTIGDAFQTGKITFTEATPVTTPGANLAVLESSAGGGQIVLDDAGGTGTALNGNGGSISLTAGTAGIVALAASNTAAEIATTGAAVVLLTTGPVGSSSNRIQFGDNSNTAQQVVSVGSPTVHPSGVYLDGLGSLTLGSVNDTGKTATLDITARTNLVVSTGSAITSGSGPIMLGADLKPDETGDDGIGKLTISSAAVASTTGTITLRGADIDIDTSASPAVVGGFQVNAPVATALVIRSSVESRPIEIGGTNNAAVAGINLTNAEMAQLVTTASGTVTIGDSQETGNITFATATPATTAGASVAVVENTTSGGKIILDDAGGTGTALNGNGGNLSISAGTGGIVAASSSNATPEIATTGAAVTLLTTGPIGTTTARIQFAGNSNTSQQVIQIGSTALEPSSVYLDGLGSLTLGNTNAGGALDITARTNLVVAAGAVVMSSGPIMLGADLTPSETGDDGVGTLNISAGASVATPGTVKLRGADVDVATGTNPAVVGTSAQISTTPSRVLAPSNPTYSLAVDSSGNLYSGDGIGEVDVFAPGATTPTYSIPESGAYPIALGPDNSLYVGSYGEVDEFAPGATTASYSITGFGYVVGLVVDSSGTLYVADNYGTVTEYAPGQTTPSKVLSGIASPYSLAVDSSGTVYATGGYDGTIEEFAAGATSPSKTIHAFGSNSYPIITVAPNGTLYAAPYTGGTILEFAPGATTASLTLSGFTDVEFLTLDSAGNLYVADGYGDAVDEFAPGATTASTTLGGFTYPWDVVLDQQGDLYVGDGFVSQISEFSRSPITTAVDIQSSVESRPIQIGGTNNSAVAGINLTTAELAQIATTPTATVTIGDSQQTGDITFTTATPVTTPGASLDVVEDTSKAGHIVLDESNGTGTGLSGNGGTVTLTPSTGGVETTLFATGLPLSTEGFSAQGDLDASLGFVPNLGTSLTVIDNTADPSQAINGAFSNVAQGQTIALDDGGTSYYFQADYNGGDGNDLVLTRVAGPATQLLVTTAPPSTVTAGDTFSLTVTAEDAQGNVASSFNGDVTIGLDANPGSATLGGTLTVSAASGIAIFSDLSLDKAGAGYTLSITSDTLTSATAGPITVTPGAATQLVIIAQPTSVTSDSSFAVTVDAEDAEGNVDPTYVGSVSIGIDNNPASGTLSGTATLNAVAGEATFTGLSLDKAGAGYTLSITGGGLLSAVTSPITVTAGAATQLVITAQPTTVTAGSPFTLSVDAEDAEGNIDLTYVGSVSVAIDSNPAGGTLSGTATLNAAAGVATFTGLSLDKAGAGYTLSIDSGTLTSATAGPITVSPGAATQLVIAAQPTSVTAGTSFPVTVEAEDALGNIDPTYTGSVSVAIDNNPAGGTLSGTTMLNAASGEATFTPISLDKAGVGYTLSITSGSLTSATSGPITVTPGAATQLVIAAQPTSVTAGMSFTVTVDAEDAFGNIDPTYTGSVVVTIDNNPASGTLSGTAMLNAANGVATFTGLSLDKAGAGYTLSITSGTLTSATAGPITVAPGAATQLVIVSQPTSVTAGSPFALSIDAEDAEGNIDPTFAGSISVAIANNPASGTLGGTATLNAVTGIATFTGLSLDKAGAGYTLSLTSGGLTSDTTGPITVTPGAATQLVITGGPTSVVAGTPFGLTVEAEDAEGNIDPTFTGSISLVIGNNPGSATLSGTTVIHAAGGLAAFTGLSLDNPGTGYTLEATSGGLASGTTGPFNVSSLSHVLTITGNPGDNVRIAFLDADHFVVIINGTATNYSTADVSQLVYQGPAGFSKVVFSDAINTYTASQSLQGTTLVNTSGFEIDLEQIAYLAVYAGGNSTANVHVTPGSESNFFVDVLSDNYSYIADPAAGIYSELSGFGPLSVDGTSTTYAYIYSTSGAQTDASPTKTTYQAGGVTSTLSGFPRVYVVGAADGTDAVTLDSSGGRFVSTPGYSYATNATGSFLLGTLFCANVTAIASGAGTDAAVFYSYPHDTFNGAVGTSSLSGTTANIVGAQVDFRVEAFGYLNVAVFESGSGTDTAALSAPAGASLYSSPVASELVAGTTTIVVNTFYTTPSGLFLPVAGRISVTATSGTGASAIVDDSAGNNVLAVGGSQATLTVDGRVVALDGFDTVEADEQSGTSDVLRHTAAIDFALSTVGAWTSD